jgi:Spy/CpxP family protein refolding chaperone
MMGGGGPMKRCGKMLMRAHPEMLKEKLGLNDDQITRIRTVRNDFLTKRVRLQSQAAEQKVRLRILFEEDLPNEGKVLDAMRKARNAKGRMMEAGVKTQLKLMRVLTPQQRKEMRKKCHNRRRGNRFGKSGKGRFGKGKRHGKASHKANRF